jgi:activator of HSP90 ATPase
MGSTWNANSWHWEERNYSGFATTFLKDILCKVEVTVGDAVICIYEVKTLTGSANVTIRKGKQLFMFEFESELYFKAKHISDGVQECSGKIKLFEFNQEDDELNGEVTCEKPGTWCDNVRRAIRKEVMAALLVEIMKLPAAMKARDVDENKLKADK